MDENCVPCYVCGKNFSKAFNLKRHLNNVHMIKTLQRKKFTSLEFETENDFNVWKEEMEIQTRSWYVKRGGKRSCTNGTVLVYYDCCRSGTYQPRGKGIRRLKAQNSSKIGCICPSKICVKLANNRIGVRYFPTHENHSEDLRHLRLPKSVKIAIAEKLIKGIPEEKILDEFRNSCDADNRIRLLNKRDIKNIKRDFHISRIQQDIQHNVKKPNSTCINNKMSLLKKNDINNIGCDLLNNRNTVEHDVTHNLEQINEINSTLMTHFIEVSDCIPATTNLVKTKVKIFVELYNKCTTFTSKETDKIDKLLNSLILQCADHLSKRNVL